MFKIRRFASNSLDYSYFSKKYHNYDNFSIDYWTNYSDILAFNQCYIHLEFGISISLRPFWYLQFFKKGPTFNDWCLRSPHLALSHYYQAK